MKEVITKTVIEVYFAKANKVIDSCENLRQLEVARNYVNKTNTLQDNYWNLRLRPRP